MRVWPPITKFDDASAVYTEFPIARTVAFAGLAVAGDAGRIIVIVLLPKTASAAPAIRLIGVFEVVIADPPGAKACPPIIKFEDESTV